MLGVGWVTFLWLAPLIGRGPAPALGAVTALAAWHLALGTGTEVVRSRRERFAEVARSRAEARRRQASEERLRMAQELHDVLAHNISLISVQAGVGLHLLDEQPEQARRSLMAIKDASRDALDELRGVLEVLRRDGDDAAPRVPAPRLSTDLPALVSKTSASGVEVDLRLTGIPHALPPAVDRAAFRIAQEALTNVARHAGRTTAHVEVRYLDDGVVVQVDDDGSDGTDGSTESPRGSGAGITGMRERAAALGGHLDAGPRPGGGFRVRAFLPVAVGTRTAPDTRTGTPTP
jgi:signal transduction histidine kinase